MTIKNPSKYQLAVFENVRNGVGHTVISAVAGSGKCLGLGTPVMLHDGLIKPVEAVEVGDLLMGPDSEPRKVMSTTRGHGPLFRIVPVKGDSWVCNDVHVLTLAGTNRRMGEVRDVALCDLIQETSETGVRLDRDWKIWRVGTRFERRDVPVDPYLVGLWLGDGTRGEAQITNCEPEIIDYCREIASKYGHECVLRRDDECNTYNIRFRIGVRGETGPHTPSVLRRFFQGCEVGGHKIIPVDYVLNDESVRLALLAGLLDTDGYISGGSYDWVTVSHAMAEQVLFLARSLGFAAYSSDKLVKGVVYKRLSISGALDRIPNRVARRKASPRKQIKRVECTGFSAEYVGKGDFYGFTLDGDGRFLLGDFTVTHNTTTIVEAMSHVPPGRKTLFVAFNKSIAEELKKRAPRGVEVSTLHSYGLRVITRAFGRLPIDSNKVDDLIVGMYSNGLLSVTPILRKLAKELQLKHADELFTFDFRRDMAKVVSLAKGTLASDEAEVDALIDTFGIDLMKNTVEDEDDDVLREAFVKDVLKVLLQCTEVTGDGRIDFDDMIWLPVVLNLSQPKFARVFIDETQDLNRAQIEMALRAVAPGGRICAVGDPRQAIYGFRGADSGAVDNIVKRLEAKVLPLSVCYRCCKAVIREAQTVVPGIEWAPDAEEGQVNDATGTEMVRDAQPGDFILSRTNAPLVSLCMAFLRQGRKASIQGRDIGGSLAAFVRRSKAKTVSALCDYVEDWRESETKRLAAKRRDTQAVEDRAECILALADGASSVGDVIARIEELFADKDDQSRIVLSTTHKAKGLERERVWVLSSTYRRRPEAEEDNLYYVAVTRARKALFLVEGDWKKKTRGQ